MAKKNGIDQDLYLMGVEAGHYKPRGRPVRIFNEKEIEELRDLFAIHIHIRSVVKASHYKNGKLLRDLVRNPDFMAQVEDRREELKTYMTKTRIY